MMAFLLLLLCACHLLVHGDASTASLRKVDELARTLARANLFGGMAQLSVGGQAVLSKGYGYASPELRVKMRADHRFGIGSNTKLFTAVAIWQLHVAGKLDVNSTVDNYLDMRDYGFQTQRWCPTLVNDTTGTCRPATLVQLMSMQSGLMDTDNCAYPSGSFQIEYCWGNAQGLNLTQQQLEGLGAGAVSLTELLTFSNIFALPLEQPPGTGLRYVNVQYLILAAVIEKVTNLTTRQYFERQLFQPAGLTDTLFDLSNGNDGIISRMLYPPQYDAQLSPGALGVPALSFDAFGNDTISSTDVPPWPPFPPLQGGDVIPKRADGGQGAPWGVPVKISRRQGLLPAIIWNLDHAAGSIISTHRDMARWFRTLTRSPQTLGLTPAAIRDIFTRGMPTSPEPGSLTFAQGISTLPDPSHPLGARALAYAGDNGCLSFNYLELDPKDPAKDVHITTFTYLAPSTALFTLELALDPHPPPSTKRPVTSPSDGHTVCLMRLNDDPALFEPVYGAGGWGLPTRSKAAFEFYLRQAKAAGSALAAGESVPVPHILCDGVGSGGMGVYLASQLAAAQLGRPWLLQ